MLEDVLAIGVILLTISGMWKVYVKAGQDGWTIFIPLYNYIVFLEILGKSMLWVIPLFIPFINIIAVMALLIDLAKCFGRSTLFGLGLFFLPFIFFPILGFGDSKYTIPEQKAAE